MKIMDFCLLPVTRSKGNHYLNPIHILEYFDKIKLPNYDSCCPSVSKELHQRLTCNICFKYFPTINFIKIHKKEKHPQNKTKNNRLYQQLNSNLNYEAPNILNNQLISTSPSENQSYYQPALKISLSQKETFSQSNQSNINSIVV